MTSLGPVEASGPDKIIPRRRTVRLDIDDTAPAAASEPRTTCNQPRFAGRDRWLRLAELVIGTWAATLRTALLMVVAFVGVVVLVGVAFGFGSAVLGALLGGAVMHVVTNRLPCLSAARQ